MSSASPTDAKARGLGQPKSVTGRLKNAITSRRLKSALGIKKLSLPTLKVSPGAMAKALKARMARGLRYDDEIVLAKTRIKIADEKFDPRRFVDVRPFTKTFFPELDIIADADELNDYRKIFSKVFNSVAPGEVPLSPCNTEERDIIYQGLYTWRDSLKGEVENLRRSGRAESFDMENRMRVLGDLVYLISEMEKRDADGVCTNYTDDGMTTGAEALDLGERGQLQELLRMFAFLVLQAKFKLPEYKQFTEEATDLVETLKREPVTEGEMNGFLTLLRESGESIPGVLSEVLDSTETQPGLLMIMVEDVLRNLFNEIAQGALERLSGDLLTEFTLKLDEIRAKDTNMRARILELMVWFVSKLKATQDTVENKEGQIIKLSGDIETANKTIVSNNENIKQLQEQKMEIENGLAEMTKQYKEAASGAAEAKAEVAKRDATITELERIINQINKDNAGLNGRITDLTGELETCRSELAAARAELAALQETNNGLNAKLELSNKEIEGLKADIAAKQEELNSVKRQLDDAKAGILAKGVEIERLQKQLSEKTAEAADLKANVARLEEELKALKASAATAAAGAAAAGAAATAKIAELNGEIAGEKEKLAAVEAEKLELNKLLETARAELAKAKTESDTEITRLNARIAELESSLKEIDAELRAKIDQFTQEKGELNRQVAESKAAAEAAQEKQQEAQAEVQVLTAKLQDAAADISRVRAEIAKQVDEIETLRGQLKACEEKSNADSIANTAKINALTKEIQGKEAERAATATKLAECEAEAREAAEAAAAAAKKIGELEDAKRRAEAAAKLAESIMEAEKAAAAAAASGATARETALKDEVAGLEAQLAEVAGSGAGSAQKIQEMEDQREKMLAEIKRVAALVSEGKNPEPKNFQNAGINNAFMDLLTAMRRVAATSANQLCYLSYFITFFYKVLFFNKREFNRRFAVLESARKAAQAIFKSAWDQKIFSRAGDTQNDERIVAFKCLAALFEPLYAAETMFLTDQHFRGDKVEAQGDGIYVLKRDKQGQPDGKRAAYLRAVKAGLEGAAVAAQETQWVLGSMFENLNINLPDIQYVPALGSALGDADPAMKLLAAYNMFTYIRGRSVATVAEPRIRERLYVLDVQGGFSRTEQKFTTPATSDSPLREQVLTDISMSYHTLFCLFMAMGELYLRKSEGLLRENQCALPMLLTNNAAFLEAMGKKEEADAASRKALEEGRAAEIAARQAAAEAERKKLQQKAENAETGKAAADIEASRLLKEAAAREAELEALKLKLAEAERKAAAEAAARGELEKAEELKRAAEEAERQAREAEARRRADEEEAARTARAALDTALRNLEAKMKLISDMGDDFDEDDISDLERLIRALAALNPTETKYTDAITRGATMKVDLQQRLAGRRERDTAVEAARFDKLKGAETTVRLRIKQGNQAKDAGAYDIIPDKITSLQDGVNALAALNPPAGSSYYDAWELGRATIADLQNFMRAQLATAPAEPAGPPTPAPAPAGPIPYERVAGQSAGLMISGSNPKKFIAPDFMVEVAPSSGPNKIMLKDKFSMVRSHFGLLVTATGVYDSTDFIAKINQQYKAMKKKAGPTITLITPSYIVNIGGPLTLNKESFFTRGGTWTMAGGGSRRSNRARATRATRKRGHN